MVLRKNLAHRKQHGGHQYCTGNGEAVVESVYPAVKDDVTLVRFQPPPPVSEVACPTVVAFAKGDGQVLKTVLKYSGQLIEAALTQFTPDQPEILFLQVCLIKHAFQTALPEVEQPAKHAAGLSVDHTAAHHACHQIQQQQTPARSGISLHPLHNDVQIGHDFFLHSITGILSRWQTPEHGRCLGAFHAERHRQRRCHVQRKYPRVHLHRARILVTGQRLNDLQRLAVIEQVHDPGVAEGVRRQWDGKMHAVILRPLYGSLQPVAHRLIGRGPERFAAPGAFGGHPAPDLMHVAGIRKRYQANRILRGPAAPAADLFRQDAHEGTRPVRVKGLWRQRTGLADARGGVPQRAEQKVVAPVRHVVQQRADLGRQQVAGRDAVGGGHAPQRHRGGKVRARRKRQRGDAFW